MRMVVVTLIEENAKVGVLVPNVTQMLWSRKRLLHCSQEISLDGKRSCGKRLFQRWIDAALGTCSIFNRMQHLSFSPLRLLQ